MLRLASPQTYRVIAYLLEHPHTSQVEVSRGTGASRNLVNHVVKQLRAPGILAQRARGDLELTDPLRLFEGLSIQRPLSNLLVKEVRTEESDVRRVERMVRNAATHTSYALTAFAALSRYIEYYITYPTVHIYCDKPLQLAANLNPGRGDVTVQVLKPDSDLILANARPIRGLMVAEPIQVVIDLFCGGGAGRDGAMKLYREIVKE